MRFLIVFITILASNLTLLSCASEMPGVEAVEIVSPSGSTGTLEVAMDEMEDLSSEEYRAFKVSVKNNSDNWARIDKVNIAFPHLGPQTELLLGSDLASYIESVTRRNNVNAYNRSLLVGSIYALGAVGGTAAARSGHQELALTGFAVGGGAATYAAVDSILESKTKAEFQSTLPEQHLLRPFDVAPKMVLSRWIIIKLKEKVDYQDARIELSEKGQSKRTFAVTSIERKRIIHADKLRKAAR